MVLVYYCYCCSRTYAQATSQRPAVNGQPYKNRKWNRKEKRTVHCEKGHRSQEQQIGGYVNNTRREHYWRLSQVELQLHFVQWINLALPLQQRYSQARTECPSLLLLTRKGSSKCVSLSDFQLCVESKPMNTVTGNRKGWERAHKIRLASPSICFQRQKYNTNIWVRKERISWTLRAGIFSRAYWQLYPATGVSYRQTVRQGRLISG